MHPRRNRSQSVSEGARNRQRPSSTKPISLIPFAIPAPLQQIDTQLPLPYTRSHGDYHLDPLDDVFRAMAMTYATQPQTSTSDSPIQYAPQIPPPHPNPNLLLPPQIDATTLAWLQLLQAQAQSHLQLGASPNFHLETSRDRDRGEGPSSSNMTAHSASDDGNAEDDEDQAENSETERSVMVDDKRRRNTAASARFRNKKKQWVLNLERTVSGLSRRVDELEREAYDLRRENGWLKEIVMLRTSKLSATPASRDTPTEPDKGDDDGTSKGGGLGSGKGKGKQKRSP